MYIIVHTFFPLPHTTNTCCYDLLPFCFRFGDSTGDLTVSLLAFPTKWIILIGALLSTIGAGLQTLTGYVIIIMFQRTICQLTIQWLTVVLKRTGQLIYVQNVHVHVCTLMSCVIE